MKLTREQFEKQFRKSVKGFVENAIEQLRKGGDYEEAEVYDQYGKLLEKWSTQDLIGFLVGILHWDIPSVAQLLLESAVEGIVIEIPTTA